MFFFGALQAVAAMAWWSADLGARYLGWYPAQAWAVPPMWAHAWLLIYGLFPFFFFYGETIRRYAKRNKYKMVNKSPSCRFYQV